MINGAALLYGLVIIIAPYLVIGVFVLLNEVLDDIVQSIKRRKRK